MNMKRETTNWNEAKNDFNEIVQSYLKSSDANTTLYAEFAGELEEQSQVIESSYKELGELVSKIIDKNVSKWMEQLMYECYSIENTIDFP